MTELQDIRQIQKYLEQRIESLREEYNEKTPKHKDFLCCIHIEKDKYTASVWRKEKSPKEKDHLSEVEWNDIKNGKLVIMDQDEFCKSVQNYLCSINHIRGYPKI